MSNVHITYTPYSDGSIHATFADDDGKDLWPGGHFLSEQEKWFRANEPSTCDAQLALLIPAPATPPTLPTPLTPVTSSVDPSTAATTIAQRNALKAQLDQMKAALEAKVLNMPIEQAQAAVAAIAALPQLQ